MKINTYSKRLLNLLCLFLGVKIVVPTYIAIPFGPVYISLDRIVFVILLAFWLIGLFYGKTFRNTLWFRIKENKAITFSLLGFLFVQWIAAFASVDAKQSFLSYLYYFSYVMVGYFCILSIPTRGISIKKIINTFIISTLFLIVIALIQIITNENPFSYLLIPGTLTRFQIGALKTTSLAGIRRVQASFSNPLAFGHYIILIVPILFFFKKYSYKKGTINIIILFLFIICFFIRSRAITLLLLLFVCYGLYYLLFVTKTTKIRLILKFFFILFIGILVIGLLFIVSMPEIQSFFGGKRILYDQSRITQLLMAIPIIKANFFLGVGFSEGAKVLGFGAPNGVGASIDNYFLRILLDSGVITLVFFICFLSSIFSLYFNSKKADKFLLLGLFLFIANFISVSLTQVHIIFYFLLALYLVKRTNEKYEF